MLARVAWTGLPFAAGSLGGMVSRSIMYQPVEPVVSKVRATR